MKKRSCFVALVLLAVISCSAQDAADPFMGDWTGEVSVQGTRQDVSVYMIPLGQSRYEARFVRSFSDRGPWLYRLRGEIRNGQLKFIDDIPFDVARVKGTTQNGVVLKASLWTAQAPGASGSIAGEQEGSFILRQSSRVSPNLGKAPPADATVLLGKNGLERWRSREKGLKPNFKALPEGVVEVQGGDIVSEDNFGDHLLHIEFRLPYMPEAFGQGRGNSGVYLQSRYEVQVLDSYGLEGADNECGGIYQTARPRVNMCAPPLQWQSYDIEFRQAKIDETGRKLSNAQITVIHNGVVIHERLELPKVTGGAISEQEGIPAGLMLQDHGNPVQYRNIWARRLK